MSGQVEERLYRIGEAAERAGVTARTIRYYEELGLIGGGVRSKGSHRLYDEADIARMSELVRLRDLLGLTLEELTELAETEQARAALRDQWAETTSDGERLEIVRAAIALVERQLTTVAARRERLDEFAAELAAKLDALRRRLGALERPVR